jgi:heat shock protein HslJ
MRRALSALLCTTVLLAGVAACARRDSASPPAAPGTAWPEGREFWSTAVIEDGAAKVLAEGTKLTVEFGEPGQLRLHAGCNQLYLYANLDGGRIKPYDYTTTMMACPGGRGQQDAWMHDFFTAGPSWSVDGDDLTLRTDRIEVRLTDKEVLDPDRSLTGQRWVVTTVISETTASSTLLDAAYLEFAADGMITGQTPCATLTGTSTVDADTIAVGSIERADRPCEGSNLDLAAELDEAVMATLTGSVAFTIDARTLTLRAASGDGLVLTAAQ